MPQDASPLISDELQNARAVPARMVPVPQTVSADLQKLMLLALPGLYRMEPMSREEWKGIIDAATALWAEPLPQLREPLRVRTVPHTLGGVKVFVTTPEGVAPEDRNRLLVHLHAGAYVALEGESGTGEAILIAHYGKITVVSVDYRLALDHPFPAALEDSVAVWADLVKTHQPTNMGLFGSSAGEAWRSQQCSA